MKELIITLKEITWLSRDYMMDFGWGNGYVDLPPEHPQYKVHYDDIPVIIHGGLTYSDMVNGNWRVGFDTAHYGDTLEKWSKWDVLIETMILKSQLEKLWESV